MAEILTFQPIVSTRIRVVVAACAVGAWIVVLIALWPEIRSFLSTHPPWLDFLASVAAIGLPIIAYFELRHSGDANQLRAEANELQDRIGELEAEKAQHLAQIAANTKRPITQAERNAEILRRHLGACVSVTEGNGSWPSTPLIVEISDANIATLFTPSAGSNPQASCVQVDCGELEISEIPHGSCPLRVQVRRRYGPAVQLGEIRRWEDRNLPAATPVFVRGGTAYHATYTRQGTPERRTLYVYSSRDGANLFQLEASTGERYTATNEEISKRFMLLQVDYEAAGFTHSGSGTGGSPYPLFIHIH